MNTMIGLCLLAFATCSLAAVTKAPPTSMATATQATAITINPKLRKALLEALSNYDGEDSTEVVDTTSSSEIEDSTDLPPLVKIHTFAIDGDKSDENEVIKTIIISRPRTTLTPPRPLSNDISERKDNVETKLEKIPDPVNEESDETENLQAVRSTEPRNVPKKSSIFGKTPIFEKKEEKSKKKSSEKTVNKFLITHQAYATTSTQLPSSTTPTTTPEPITDAEGQNADKVLKNDVKILQAPLLAAFTVQQHGEGGPEKVISLFKNPAQSDINANNEKTIVNMEFKASQPIPNSITPSPLIQLPNGNGNQDLLSSFEQKQRELEDQIRFLQARQREQDEIIRQHQQIQSQQSRPQTQFNQFQSLQTRQQQQFEEEQRQRQQFDEEQRRRQRFDQEQKFLQRQQQAQSLQQPQTQPLIAPQSPSSNVQFIPSIPLSQTVGISVQQQLPFKGPVEFNPDRPELQRSFAQNQQQFNQRQNFQQFFQPLPQQQLQQQPQQPSGFAQQQQFIQKHEVRELPLASPLPNNLELPVRNAQNFVQFASVQLPANLELPQKPFQTFNSAPLSVLPSLTDIVPQTQGRTRVFRQDASQTGNFGFNDASNFQIQQQQIDPITHSLDNQLQNFFQHSGINARSADDFRIISKILSLNHGVPNNLFLGNPGRLQ